MKIDQGHYALFGAPHYEDDIHTNWGVQRNTTMIKMTFKDNLQEKIFKALYVP